MKILATTLLPRDRETQRLRPSQKLFPPSHRRRPRRSVAGCVGPATPAARLLRPRGPAPDRGKRAMRAARPEIACRIGRDARRRFGRGCPRRRRRRTGGRRCRAGSRRDISGRARSATVPEDAKRPARRVPRGPFSCGGVPRATWWCRSRRWCRPGTRGPRARRIAPWPELEGPRFGQGHVVGQPRQSPVGGAAGEECVEGEGAGSHDPSCRTPGLTPRAIRTARPRPRHRLRRGCGRTPPRAAPARPRPPAPRPPPAGSGRRAPARRSRGCAGRGRSPP